MALTEAPSRRITVLDKPIRRSSSEIVKKKTESSVPPIRQTLFEAPQVISLRVDTDPSEPPKESNVSCPDASEPRDACKVPVSENNAHSCKNPCQ